MGSKTGKKPKTDPATKRARELELPEAQIMRGFVLHRVANYTEEDQRAMVRSGKTETVRRPTRVELMVRAGVIDRDQALACEWIASAHELGFQTVGCTANYNGSGGGGFGSSDLLARYKDQAEARENYYYARQGIPSHLVGLFEDVVLGTKQPESREDKLLFSLAAFRLYDQIYHLLAA